MKATEQYFPVVLFIILYKVVLTFESVDKILKCDHSNESLTEQYFPVVLFIMLYKVVLTFESVDDILSVTIQMKAIEQYSPGGFDSYKKKSVFSKGTLEMKGFTCCLSGKGMGH